jgi:transitional endoplasmic reticulum ATPase
MKKVEPSAMREVLVEVPQVKWKDVGGLKDVKEELQEVVEWPLKYPDLFRKVGVKAPKGILLYGPPGTGKTLLAKAVANESESNFISIKGPEILSKWVGEREKGVRKTFRRARQVAPSIIFFDEIDALAGTRGLSDGSGVKQGVVAQLLSEIDGVAELSDVVLVGATNRPDLLDPALLRPGRFEKLIYVPMPDTDARAEIFKVHTKGMKLADDVDFKELIEKTEDYSGADIEALVRKAGMLVVKESIKKKKKDATVKMEHFKKALERVKPSLDENRLNRWKGMKDEVKSVVEKD